MNCWTPISRVIRHAVVGRPVFRVRRAWSGPAVVETACKRSASAIATLAAGVGGTLGAAGYAAAQYGGPAWHALGGVVLGSGLSASALQAELGYVVGGYIVPASDGAVLQTELGYRAGGYSVTAASSDPGQVVAVASPGRPVAIPEPATSAVLCVAVAATLLFRRFK